ncbi:L-rhamnose-1-dehydrogenase [Lachnellula cervina]|uniref:L-rhamnose-1-dehydrogenase n=1 Tax=Lachnellula cervina TaxID=1316786 RepID=A0A7D8UR02_9HELO|nr:L-rhamnose-1-dehydrogenase [Lachnellula cervina]
MALPSARLLRGKTACITGGTTGIGRAITLEYLRQGANVAVNHLGLDADERHRKSLLEEAQKLKQQGAARCRLGISLRWRAMLRILRLDGSWWRKLAAEFLTLSKQQFDRTMEVNVNGTFYSCQAGAQQMVKQGKGGAIIGISSISALVGGGLQTHYTPTKAAVLSMIQSMAIALAKDRIRCNALLPGTIHTQLAEDDMQNKEKKAYLEHRIPMGRVGKPEDLAGPAVFLASEEMSGFMTGSQMLVDGGMFVHLQ